MKISVDDNVFWSWDVVLGRVWQICMEVVRVEVCMMMRWLVVVGSLLLRMHIGGFGW